MLEKLKQLTQKLLELSYSFCTEFINPLITGNSEQLACLQLQTYENPYAQNK
jgi:hypothetical protein